ncbi:MAG TPA: hypothetical protein VKR32_18400 [Puia sp.]|nr:hypothetical protein [Puia sp.]
MSRMEPEATRFLKKILISFSIGFGWLMLNMILGIYAGLLFAEDGIHVGNIIFYIIFAGSLITMILLLRRIWKEKFPHG